MLSLILQICGSITLLTSTYLVGRKGICKLYGYIFGMLSQLFLGILAITVSQWVIVLLCCFGGCLWAYNIIKWR